MHRQQRDTKADQPGKGEQQRQTAIGADAEPGTQQIDTAARRHVWDKQQLGDWTDHKGRDRRGCLLDALGEPEHATLPFGWNHFLQDGLLGGFHRRNQAQSNEEAGGQQHNRRVERKHTAHHPHDDISHKQRA